MLCGNSIESKGISNTKLVVPFLICGILFFQAGQAFAWTGDFLSRISIARPFALDPDVIIRKMDPDAPRNAWTLGEGKGIPPFYFRTTVPGLYDRVDFIYPFGCREE